MSEPRHYRFWPDSLPKQIDLPSTPIHANLERSAEQYPDQTATVFYGAELTYAELLQQTHSLAGHLQQQCGVEKGDRVILFMQNCPQFVVAYYAILSTGAIVVPVNPMNVTEEMRHYIDNSGAICAIASQENTPKLLPLINEGTLRNVISATYSEYLPSNCDYDVATPFSDASLDFDHEGVFYWHQVIAANTPMTAVDVTLDDGSLIIYTSGSTGAPKGCLHSHGSALATITFSCEWTAASHDSASLAVVPFFHVTGMQFIVNTMVNAGGTLVILPRWDAVAAATMVENHRCTHWINVPVMVIDMLNNATAMERDISSLQFIMGGGAAMPEAVAAKLFELCGVEYVEGYGLSESAGGGIVNPISRPKRQCLGIPWLNTEARIVDPETLKELEPGEPGEILISSPQVFKGYWNNPEASQETLVQLEGSTWLRTGDLGYMDEEGYYFITDRIKRMINAAGYKVWPAEVEATLYKHEHIQEACIISSPDERRGETVKAVIVLKPDSKDKLSADELIGWSREQLSAYKVPRKVEFVDALPRTGTGKINWRQLQEAEHE
ncbi:MAG: long-chain-fatty-acid--CoA ligase [Halopseudomonas sp.]